jgi:hypothetical protein
MVIELRDGAVVMMYEAGYGVDEADDNEDVDGWYGSGTYGDAEPPPTETGALGYCGYRTRVSAGSAFPRRQSPSRPPPPHCGARYSRSPQTSEQGC